MKRRILSLLLMISLLLSVVPAVAATETATEPTWSCSLTLQESIAINFNVVEEDLTDFEQIAFYKGETLVKTVTEKPTAEGGKVSFTFADLTPGELGTKITAKLTLGGTVHEKSLSVQDYCKAILSGYYHTSLKKIAADLLNYGAASQTYVDDVATTLVNANLSAYEQALATQGDPTLQNILAQSEAIDGATATWEGVGLNLQDSVTIRFKFNAESADGLTLKVTCDGKTWEISQFQSAGNSIYYAYLSELNPAQMRDTVTAVLCNAESTPVSRVLTYSVASYAAYVVNEDTAGAYADELDLVKAMVRYGDAVSAWLTGGKATIPADSVIADGEYVITAVDTDGNQLGTLGNTDGSNSDICVGNSASWTIRVLDETGAAYLTAPNGEYPVRANGSSNMAIGYTKTVWTIAKSGDYYTFKNTNSDDRFLAYNGTGFKAYAEASDTRFIQFMLIPVAETEEPLRIVENGNYMIIAVAGDKYYVMDTSGSNGVVTAKEVTVENGSVTASDVPYWHIEVLDEDGTAILTNADGNYVIRTKNSSNLTIGGTETAWIIAKEEDTGYYTFTNVNGDTRYLAYNGSGFKAYAAANDSRFIQFMLIPVSE